ncbi:MAG: HD domain-containing protein [Candidatus Liptonbacteria bacterium]|nr:HD domain-containing protein [Candidatus Liptonbacteria bacterium]
MNRDKFFGLILNKSEKELREIIIAYWFSKNVHRVQSRDTGERYFEHPRRAALTLLRMGFDSTEEIITGLLHDALEDTFAPKEVYPALFGGKIYKNLQTLSKSLPVFDGKTGKLIKRRKKDIGKYYAGILNGSPAVRRVKCADRIDNLKSFGVWPTERKAKYVKETIEFILPIARRTDQRLVKAINRLIKPLA